MKKFAVLSIALAVFFVVGAVTFADQDKGFCPTVYDPVCGVDGQTYSNFCVAFLNSVDVLYNGECNSSVSKCDYDYNTDGVVDRRDAGDKRKNIKQKFQTWVDECWRQQKNCADQNSNGVVDRTDLKEKQRESMQEFEDWIRNCWLPEMKAQSAGLGRNAKVSECGGFNAKRTEHETDEPDETDDNCRDEGLVWKYDNESKTVSFLNKNVWLNCCGKHFVSIRLNEKTGVYEILETDKPEMDGNMPLRCDCMCFFDFNIDLPRITSKSVRIKISRHVTDSGDKPVTVWEGELDLTKGQGYELIKANVGWCQFSDIGKNAKISECGGFDAERTAYETDNDDDNCKDEGLAWKYDNESKTVRFQNKNVWLNCCGEHSAIIRLNSETGVYEIRETDRPQTDTGRCYCSCFFDFDIDLPEITSETIKVKIIRDITDDNEQPSMVWEGELDLTKGQGYELVKADTGWCQPANLGKNAKVSACGGFDTKRTANEPDDNCRNEGMSWNYDNESKTVRFQNENVWLNCCGEHSIIMSLNSETGIYEIRETDRPDENGRCKCMCFFDFNIDLPDITSETIRVKLFRHVTDNDEQASVVWEGELDLTKGQGYELIKSDIGWCESGNLGKNAKVSACGGFDAERTRSYRKEETSDCRDEELAWQYDNELNKVSFLNNDVWLNCCGQHSVTISLNSETSVYEILETDKPEIGGGRCSCMCFFDFNIDLPDISSETIKVNIFRHVTDYNEPPSMIWEGELDLSKGQGNVLIQENIGWCN